MNQQELVDVTCRACNKSTHIILECPMVCGYPNRSKVLLNYRRNVPSDRVKYARKLERKIQTRRESSDIQNSIYLYMCKTQMLKEQIDKQHYSGGSYDEGASVLEDGNDGILEYAEKADKELKSNALLAPLRTQMTQYQLQRKLSFQACTDALQDDEIRNRILEIINQIQKAERSNKYQSRFNQGPQQLQPYLRVENHQNTLLSNKSIQDPEKRMGEFQRGDQKKSTKQVAIKVNDFSKGQLYANRTLDEDPGKKLGQYLDIFEGFEKVRNFEYFLKHNNANEIARLYKVNKIQRKHKQTK